MLPNALLFIYCACACFDLYSFDHRSRPAEKRFGNATMPCKNIGTNDKFCRKVALLRYTEWLKFRSQSRETASKRKPYRGLGTR